VTPYLARRAFAGRRVLVAVCGGVAAYKLVETVSLLVQAHAEVRVAMTPEAIRFITPLTFEAVSGRPVSSDLFGEQASGSQASGRDGELHISLAQWAEAMLCAPATANVIAKLAQGLADEVVSTTILASKAPLVLAPAMHEVMWEDTATQENVDRLRRRGVAFAGPVRGRLASGEVGQGRLAEQDAILRALRDVLPGERDMAGLTVLVTAGGTREPLDPVRYVGNRSSGLMGHSLSAAAEARGARTHLITSASLPAPPGVEVTTVGTAAEMHAAVHQLAPSADVLVMAAAVADVRPRHAVSTKLAKSDLPLSLELEATEDILGSLSTAHDLVKVGFAAETHELESHARGKLVQKGLDLVVANDVSDPDVGMGSAENAAIIFLRDGPSIAISRAPKEEVADRILDATLQVIESSRSGRRRRRVS